VSETISPPADVLAQQEEWQDRGWLSRALRYHVLGQFMKSEVKARCPAPSRITIQG
jgi:hypothetical protein